MASPLPASDRVLFVVGCPRSGTTWLQTMLCASPVVRSGPETHLFTKYITPMVQAYDRDVADDNNRDGMKAFFSREAFGDKILRPMVKAFWAEFAPDLRDDEVIVEKTPGHILRPFLMKELVPGARVIHIVRDPRAVVASWRAAAREAWGHWARQSLADICATWVTHVSTRDRCRIAFQRNYLEMRYEDLLAEPARHLESIFAWAELPADRPFGEIAAAHGVERLRQPDVIAADPRLTVIGERTNFVRRGEAEAWRDELSAGDIEQVELRCGELMRRLGYRLESEHADAFD